MVIIMKTLEADVIIRIKYVYDENECSEEQAINHAMDMAIGRPDYSPIKDSVRLLDRDITDVTTFESIDIFKTLHETIKTKR